MGLGCRMCNAVVDNFACLLNHYRRVHKDDAHFNIVCGIGGCGTTYRNFFSYRSHVERRHGTVFANRHNITDEEVLGNADTEPEGDQHRDYVNQGNVSDIEEVDEVDDDGNDLPEVDMRATSAAYLMRIKETHNLAQKALDDIIKSTTVLVNEAVKSVCANAVKQLDQVCGGGNQITWQELYRESCGAAAWPFQYLMTENSQKQAYKEFFGLVVSTVWWYLQALTSNLFVIVLFANHELKSLSPMTGSSSFPCHIYFFLGRSPCQSFRKNCIYVHW